MRRLESVQGEWIDRSEPIEFTFEGRPVRAVRGDTISSALLAAGHSILGRSFKYHRPRGILSGAGHDVNAMMQVREGGRSVPNVRADSVLVQPGWDVKAVNTAGGLASDRLSVLNRLSAFLPVGFYYKAFHSKRLFPRWERMFRRITGLGEVDLQATARSTPKRYQHCDVLVVGAGPSGLAAAGAAAERGASVLLVDENPNLGGSALYALSGTAEDARIVTELVSSIRANPRVQTLTGSYAAGYYADHWVPVVAASYMVKVRARSVIIAQGAYEQPAVFRGNDIPGVMLSGAALRLLHRYAVAVAKRVAVIVANAEGYQAALAGQAHGIEIAAVLDLRPEPGPASLALAQSLAKTGVPLYRGVKPVEALAGASGRVHKLIFEAATPAASGHQALTLDGVWMSVGFAPANALLHQAGARMSYAHAVEQFVPSSFPPGVFACGKINGVYDLDARIADGRYTGAKAAAQLGLGPQPVRDFALGPGECPTHPYPIFPHPRGKEFVDFDEDLQIKDLQNACQEGFDSIELLKRFSTLGMGPSQGKHSNMNGVRILARLRGEPIEKVGTTTARPFFHPVPLSHLAGRRFSPERRTPLDEEHRLRGAVWMQAGNWRRPEYYAMPGKSREEAITEEVRAVRTDAGVIDVGTLGKIEVHGPDAVLLLERVYTARFANLKVGMTRYGLMLDESGVVIDDGVIARLGPESFYFTTTTGNSASVYRELARLATLWGLQVGLVNLTGHYAAFNIAGPASRATLAPYTDIDLSEQAFPYLAVREGHIAGAPCRAMRVGFVGELGYEIHVPASAAIDVWRALFAGDRRLRPFGVEAQRMLRLEKGHLIVGQDTDGVTNALELNMGWALRMEKPFFVGQRSLRSLSAIPRRQSLVGFRIEATASQTSHRRVKESHLVIEGSQIAGRVTSVGWSPTLQCLIGLALVHPGVASGKQLSIRVDGGGLVTAELTTLPFYDPHGERQRMTEPA